jgi:hypothetical protein
VLHLVRKLPLWDPLSTPDFDLSFFRITFGNEEIFDDLIVDFDVGEA